MIKSGVKNCFHLHFFQLYASHWFAVDAIEIGRNFEFQVLQSSVTTYLW